MKNSLIATIFVIFFLGAAHLHAQSDRVTIFRNANLIDGTGSPPRQNISLIVRGDAITLIASADQTPAANGATIIDTRGKTIIPAFILAHAHVGLVQGTSSSPSHLTEENILRQLNLYASYGVGTVASLGLDHDLIFDLRDRREKHELLCPRILTAGHGFTAPSGGPPKSLGDQLNRPATPEEARADVDKLAALHPDLLKIWLDDFGGSSKRISPEIYKALIDQAHKHHIRVAAHIYYLADAKAIVAAGVDILAHSVRDLPVDDELIRLMKSHGTFLIPTLDMIEINFIYADKPAWMNDPFFIQATEPGVLDLLKSPRYSPQNRDRRVLKTAQHNLKTLYDAGEKIGFGTDTGAAPIRVQGFGEHRELQLMVDAGLTPMQALTCATQGSAALLGISDKVGTLEPGKQADFIVLSADPSQDIHNTQKIDSVWLAGQKIERK